MDDTSGYRTESEEFDRSTSGQSVDGASISRKNMHDLLVLIVSIIACVVCYTYMNQSSRGTSNLGSSVQTPREVEEYSVLKRNLCEKYGNVCDLEPEVLDMLKKKLMHRAFKTIPLILEQQEKGALSERLYKKGMMADDTTAIKNFIDKEIVSVQMEADEIIPGWNESIWAECMSFYNKMKKQVEME